MKTKNLKLFSILGVSVLMTSNILPLFIYASSNTKDSIGSINMEDDGITIGVDETQTQKTTYSEEIENEGQQGSDVYVSQASTFGVTIPKVIILDGKKNESGINKANYVVTISSESNFAGNEKILVVPDKDFTLKQLGKNDIQANVMQDKQEWKYNETSILGKGEISTNDMSAGMWKGSFNFNIELDGSYIKVEAFDKNGINLNASAKEIKNEEREQLLTSLVDTGWINNKEEVDLLINVKTNEFENMATTTFDVSSIAKENDKVVILHFNETTNEWEYISTETVDNEGKITTNMSSFSPIAFVKVDSNNFFENINLEAGLYDANNTLLCSWNDSNINIQKDYSDSTNVSNYYANSSTSAYSVITKKYPTTTTIIMPNDITYIGTYGFAYCSMLTNIKIGTNITNIKSQAFWKCENLNNIVIPNNTTDIGIQAFQGCNKLTTITIPNNVKYIGEATFQYCKNLTNVTVCCDNENYCSIDGILFTKDMKKLHSYPFGKKETSYIIPENVEIIGRNAFQGCEKLNKIIFTEGVKQIEHSAFSSCTGFSSIGTLESNSSVKLPNSLETIDAYAFFNCTNLSEVTFPSGVKNIGQYTFRNSTNLNNVILPDSLTTIQGGAFYNCEKLTSIYIPTSVTSISCIQNEYSTAPFYYCSKDLKIYCGAASKPSGWHSSWARCGSTYLSVTYGITRAEYETNYK